MSTYRSFEALVTSISWQVLQLSLADSRQYEGPEPQYAETKSSILRRRHSNAKLSNNSNNSNNSTNSRRASQRQARRVASLSDLSSSRSTGQHQHQPPHSLRRRSSLSYDDLRCPHTSIFLLTCSSVHISTQGSRGEHVALQQPLHQEVLHVHRAVAQGEDRVQRLQRLQVCWLQKRRKKTMKREGSQCFQVFILWHGCLNNWQFNYVH